MKETSVNPKKFQGPDYVPARDKVRLTKKMDKIFNLMKDGKRRTLAQLAETAGTSDSSAGSLLRQLRAPDNGGHNVDKVYFGNGLYKYRLTVNETADQLTDQQELL